MTFFMIFFRKQNDSQQKINANEDYEEDSDEFAFETDNTNTVSSANIM